MPDDSNRLDRLERRGVEQIRFRDGDELSPGSLSVRAAIDLMDDEGPPLILKCGQCGHPAPKNAKLGEICEWCGRDGYRMLKRGELMPVFDVIAQPAAPAPSLDVEGTITLICAHADHLEMVVGSHPLSRPENAAQLDREIILWRALADALPGMVRDAAIVDYLASKVIEIREPTRHGSTHIIGIGPAYIEIDDATEPSRLREIVALYIAAAHVRAGERT